MIGLLVLGDSFAATAPEVTSIDKPKNILFIGNSYTYYNNSIHNALRSLIRSANIGRSYPGLLRALTLSSAKLSDHAPAMQVIVKSADWDVIVLQGHNDEAIDKDKIKLFQRAVRTYDELIDQSKADTVLFMTWAPEDRPNYIHSINRSYTLIGNHVKALVVPVGLAFSRITEEFPGIDLYRSDGSQPTIAGTYLAACVFFAALYQESPEGLSFPTSTSLNEEKAANVQRVAWTTVQAYYTGSDPTPIKAAAVESPYEIGEEMSMRIAAINNDYVFADTHSHLSKFHRSNVETIAAEEIDIYRSNYFDLVVANISSDMAYSGGYTNRDETVVEKGKYKPEPGATYDLAADRLSRLQKTFELGIAVHAGEPNDVLRAREQNEVAILPALEGADAFEGKIENLQEMYTNGLRLVQLLHFRNNELGHNQTHPYSPGGLTPFGKEVVRECNRLGLIIDLAHSNHETMMDVLALSEDPVIFSHGGLKALFEQDRAVSDDEIRAIAEHGGMIGIWPHGRYIEDIETMVDYIEHVIKVGGIDHVGIGSDLRGVSSYSKGFDKTANFRAIAAELIERGHSDEEVGKVMGANFFRVWKTVMNSS